MLLLRKKSPGYATVCVCVHALCAGRHDAIAAAAAAAGGGGGAGAGSGGGSSSANSAVPTSMLLAVSLLYVALSACSTVSYLVARLAGPSAGGGGGEVPAWCVRALRPRLRVADRVYSIASQLHKLVFAYNFVVYVLTGRQFRAELVSRPALVRRIFTSRQTSQQSADTAL